MEDNEKYMKTEYSVDMDIETLYYQTEDAVKFAANANHTYSPVQIKRIVYNLVFQIRVFNLLFRK